MPPRSRVPSRASIAKAASSPPQVGEDCPNAAQHRHGPRRYPDAAAWANRMQHTHTQRKCEGCDRWLIWVALTEAMPAERAEWRRDVKPYLVPIDGDVEVDDA